MNTYPIESIKDSVLARFPEASVAINRPRNPRGVWVLDISFAGREIHVAWKEGNGFAVSARPDSVYGEGFDETYESERAAFSRVKELLLSGAETCALNVFGLSELRKHREVSQVELAARLCVRQASVSKMENRDDYLLGTLRSIIGSLGGRLEVRAIFDDEIVKISFEDPPVPAPNNSLQARRP